MWEALWDTEEAFRLAAQDPNCWGINADCQYTKDDVLVMYHGTTVPYGEENYSISDLTYDQVKDIILVENGIEYCIPTLDQFMQICSEYNVVCNIELKGRVPAWSWTSNEKSKLLDEIIHKAENYNLLDQMFFCVSTASDLDYIRSHYIDIPVSRVWDSATTEDNIALYITDPQVIPSGYAEGFETNNTLKLAHDNNQIVMCYSKRPQTVEMIEEMIEVGADIIIIFNEPNR